MLYEERVNEEGGILSDGLPLHWTAEEKEGILLCFKCCGPREPRSKFIINICDACNASIEGDEASTNERAAAFQLASFSRTHVLQYSTGMMKMVNTK